jgi:hypothetical protein
LSHKTLFFQKKVHNRVAVDQLKFIQGNLIP